MPVRRIFWLLACLIGIGLTARWDGFTMVTWWQASHSGVVVSEARSASFFAASPQKLVALTFDDGPDPRYTPAVLDTLRRYHIKATFFEEGRFVYANPALARQVVAEGHEIGNHTWSHPYLERKSPEETAREIDACDWTFARLLGLRTYLFRPPRGHWNRTIYDHVQQRRDKLILWTVALEHHEVPTPRAMSDRALGLIRPGGILLMHDGGSAPRDTTVQALPLLLDGLRARGYQCVTVSELLHVRGNEVMAEKK